MRKCVGSRVIHTLNETLWGWVGDVYGMIKDVEEAFQVSLCYRGS